MRFIDFFAGIGGFRRGMELAGHRCVGFCEWDKYATASYTSMHLITESQREYLSTLTLKKRQKEILKNEYRNGEWYSNDIRNVDAGSLPAADCWCFGAPCQDFSIAGKRAGLDGDRSSLIREIFRLLEEQEEQDRPEWLIYENVKGMLSSNKGLDYLSILSEMDRLGYDIEWQNINSKWFVPQNRERIYTIGHLRRYGRRKILPITGTDGENSLYQIASVPNKTRSNPNPGRTYSIEGIGPCLSTMAGGNLEPQIAIAVLTPDSIQQLGHKEAERENPNAYRVYSPNGLSHCLGTMQGGGREPSIAFPCFVDMTIGKGVNLTENARTLCARYQKGMTNHEGTTSGIAIKIIGEVNSSQDGQVHDISGIAKCHSAGHNNSPKVAIPVLTPDRAKKRQNGRRFKENGEPMFTLTSQDRHGVAICPLGVLRNVRTDYGKQIRKAYESGDLKITRHKFLAYEIKKDGCSNTLSSVEKDNYLALGIIDPQGRNKKKVSPKDICPTLRSETHGNVPEVIKSVNVSDDSHNGIYVELPNGVICYAIWYEKEQCYITIRKLTPKECFRLQGWTDYYFEKAAFVNSDSRLYMQAGNGVTVDVTYAIGKKIAECEKESLERFSKYMNKPKKGEKCEKET